MTSAEKSSHTPGPWKAVPTHFNEGYTVLAQPHPALRGFTKLVAFVGDKADEETQANALLIAAAPDLLTKGQALANQLRAVMCHLNGQAYSSTISALNDLDAALAKASRP